MARGLGRVGESVPRPRPCGVGPRASRKIGTSSEALWHEASGESENRYLVRGLVARGLGRGGESVPRPRPCGAGPRARWRISSSFEASWFGTSSEAENWYLVRGLTSGASGEAENRYLVRGLMVSFWAEPASGEPGYCSRWAGRSSRASDKVGVLPVVVSWLRFLQGLNDFFGSRLGDPFLWYPTIW